MLEALRRWRNMRSVRNLQRNEIDLGKNPREQLSKDALAALSIGMCPVCKSGVIHGPQGGMCTNMICSNIECRYRYNYCMFTGQFLGYEPRENYEEADAWQKHF